MRTRNWDKLYQTYVKGYNRKSAKSEVGLDEIYSPAEFRAIYTALEADRKREIEAGTRKVANITQDLIARQELYDYSFKQAKAIKKAIYLEYGENVRLKDIRKNSSELTDDFWDLIRNERKRLFAERLSASEVADYISETYFGSP